jgi:hypothetical protein
VFKIEKKKVYTKGKEKKREGARFFLFLYSVNKRKRRMR